MSQRSRELPGLAVFAGLALGAASVFASESTSTKDLGGYTCKEIMRLSGEAGYRCSYGTWLCDG